MKKTQIKVTVPVRMAQDLDNVSTLSGNTVQSVIRQYLAGYLYCPQPGPPGVPPPRARRVSGNTTTTTKETVEKESGADSTTPYPEDFDPPKRITDQARINREEAMRVFREWSLAKEKKYADWEKAFEVACHDWIPRARPHLRESGGDDLLETEKRDETVMDD